MKAIANFLYEIYFGLQYKSALLLVEKLLIFLITFFVVWWLLYTLIGKLIKKRKKSFQGLPIDYKIRLTYYYTFIAYLIVLILYLTALMVVAGVGNVMSLQKLTQTNYWLGILPQLITWVLSAVLFYWNHNGLTNQLKKQS